MKQIIFDEAKKIYKICHKADLVLDFDSLFTREYLIEHENGRGDRTVKELTWHVIQYALDHHKALMLDWRASAEDAVYNIKRLLPDAKVDSKGEVEKSGTWYEPVEIDSKIIDFKSEDRELLIDRVIREINLYLKKSFRCFLMTAGIGGDDHYYLLIPVSSEKDFEEYGFYLP